MIIQTQDTKTLPVKIQINIITNIFRNKDKKCFVISSVCIGTPEHNKFYVGDFCI